MTELLLKKIIFQLEELPKKIALEIEKSHEKSQKNAEKEPCKDFYEELDAMLVFLENKIENENIEKENLKKKITDEDTQFVKECFKEINEFFKTHKG